MMSDAETQVWSRAYAATLGALMNDYECAGLDDATVQRHGEVARRVADNAVWQYQRRMIGSK